MTDYEFQQDELLALASIYDENIFEATSDGTEGRFCAHLDLPNPFLIKTTSGDGCSSKSVLTQLQYLPPIMLFFRLPPDYPSCRAPEFVLSCKWLTLEQLSTLCCHLDEMWRDNAGSVILYDWASFLVDETLQFLDLHSPLDLGTIVATTDLKQGLLQRLHDEGMSAGNGGGGAGGGAGGGSVGGAGGGLDRRCVQDIGSQSCLLPALITFDDTRQVQVFERSVIKCQVCFCERSGKECMRFATCNHTYCRDCMRHYFEVLIRDGSVYVLKCPSEGCNSEALPEQVESLVSAELLVRYLRLRLQTLWDTNAAIAYCPRLGCATPVTIDSLANMGICQQCDHVFCTFCKRAYHAISPCAMKADHVQRLSRQYREGTWEERQLLERRYGRAALRRIVDDASSQEWLDEFSKPCPHCKTHIQKIDGCNKMTCSKCRSYFCWICSTPLPRNNPYSHFNNEASPCFNQLFLGVTPAEGDGDDLHPH